MVRFLIQAAHCEPVHPAGYLGILPSMCKHGEHISASGLVIKTSLSQL